MFFCRYMKMKRAFFSILFFAAIGSSPLMAQKTTELGILLGRSYYLGELNPSTHFGRETGSFNYGIAFRYNLNKRYSLKATLAQTELKAADENIDFLFNEARNASFTNLVRDFAANIEFNFLPYAIGDKKHSFSPYLFVGFNIYRSKPKTLINGNEVIGETVDKTINMAYSFGPGVKLNVGRKVSLSFEWGFRKTANDYIDGLPNRRNEIFEMGKEYNNDWFVSSNFMLTYRLTNLGPCPVYNF